MAFEPPIPRLRPQPPPDPVAPAAEPVEPVETQAPPPPSALGKPIGDPPPTRPSELGKPIDTRSFVEKADATASEIGGYVREAAKSLIRGGGMTAGSAVGGILPVIDPQQAYRQDVDKYRDSLARVPEMTETELADFRAEIDKEPVIGRMFLNRTIDSLLSGDMTPDEIVNMPGRAPVSEHPLYKAGQEIKEGAAELAPVTPGWEDSITVALGEGLGSLGVGVAAALIPGAGAGVAGALFTSAGAGESLERAIEWDEAERAAGREGLTEEQILTAGFLGIGPGATDLVPIEVLLSRFRVPAALRKGFASAVARIGGQAFVEGVQEGGQEFIQNLIQSEYDQNQELFEGITPSAAVGGGVGGIVQAGAELAHLFTPKTRRSGETRADEVAQQLEGGPGQTEVTVNGETQTVGAPQAGPDQRADTPAQPPPPPQRPADASPGGTEGGAPPPPSDPYRGAPEGTAPVVDVQTAPLGAPPPPVPPEERALLQGAGWTDENIDAMEAEERAAEVEEARRLGVQPRPVVEPITPPEQPTGEVSRGTTPQVAENIEGTALPAELVEEFRRLEQEIAAREAQIAGAVESQQPDSQQIVERLQRENEEARRRIEERRAQADANATPVPAETLAQPVQPEPATGAEPVRGPVEPSPGPSGDRIEGGPVREGAEGGAGQQPPSQVGRVVEPPRGRPSSLMEFLASSGGIRDESGELAAMGLTTRMVPQRGRLVRPTGLTHDRARELAAEAGYFDHIYGTSKRAVAESTPADLRQLIEMEAAGERIYSGQDAEQLAEWEAEQAQKDQRREIEDLIDRTIDEYDLEIDKATRKKAARIMADTGATAEDALEQAVMETEVETIDEEDRAAVDEAVPGWTDEEIEAAVGAQGERPGPESADQQEPGPADGGEQARPPDGEDGREDGGPDPTAEPLTDPGWGHPTMPAEDVFPAPDKVYRAAQMTGDEILTPEQARERLNQWKEIAKEIGRTKKNANKVIFSLFDFTGAWSQPWRDAGYEVIQYDVQQAQQSPDYEKGDERYYDILQFFPNSDIAEVKDAGMDVTGVLAATPCTTFASSGARWWESRHDVESREMIEKVWGEWTPEIFDTALEVNQALVATTEAFIELANPTDFHVMENPVGRIAEVNDLPEPLLRFDPNNYGDPYTKKTQLWGKFDPNLPTANVEATEGSKIQSKLGSKNKVERSETPEGFSYAFFIANDPDARAMWEERQRAQPTTEKGADGKEQAVIPGAEQRPAEAAQIAANAPMRPKAPQQAADEGLFGDESQQTDLVDMSRRPEPKVEPEPDRSPEPEPKPASTNAMTEKIADFFIEGGRFNNILAARKYLAQNGMAGSNKEMDEAIERGTVLAARRLVMGKSPEDAYSALVSLYESQPNLATRTGKSMADQAYSTPAPLAFIASRSAGIGKDTTVYEPTAGNGMLLIEASPTRAVANEIDKDRREAIKELGFPVTGLDATEADAVSKAKDKKTVNKGTGFEAIVMNPPFGAVREGGESKRWEFGDYKTTAIDAAVAINVLDEGMLDSGRAVLIVGSVKGTSEAERRKGYSSQQKRKFYYRLYETYNVVDHFTVSGDLYKKQGAAWPVDVVVVDGRGKSARKYPAADLPKMFSTWDELREKVNVSRKPLPDREGTATQSVRPAGDIAQADQEQGSGAQSRPGDTRPQRPVERQPERGDAQPGGRRPDTGQPARDGETGAASAPVEPDLVRDDRGPAEQSGEIDLGDVFDQALDAQFAPAPPPSGEVVQGPSPKNPYLSVETGVVFRTASGRETSPAPKIDASTDRKTTATLRRMNAWLLDEAKKEAEATGQSFALQNLNAIDLKNLSQSDQDTISLILFDDIDGATVDRVVRIEGKTAGRAARQSASEAVSGLDSVAAGLQALFGGDKASSGFSFDEETYAKAKPLFEKALAHFKASSQNAAEAMRLLVKELAEKFNFTREALARMKPYAIRFIQEQTGQVKPTERRERTIIEKKTNESNQANYQPQSAGEAMGTLVPGNMRDAVRGSLESLEEQVGPIDEFVANRMGWTEDQLYKRLGAEQIDAVALGIAQIDRGRALILGDQTGIGKGRVMATMIQYAKKQGMTPVFVTAAPDLYGDMYRDMTDTGYDNPRVLMTNSDVDLPLDEEALLWKVEADAAREGGEKIPPKRGKFFKSGTAKAQQQAMQDMAAGKDVADVVFTTYAQMQTVQGREPYRRNFLRAIAANGMFMLDEAHEASGGQRAWKGENDIPNRGEFFREIVTDAKAVIYSSATYAKRPDTMTLYSRTDMGLAVESPDMLPELIERGGVPLQQVVASMLAQSGQYIRRERSFDGIEYEVKGTPIDEDVYAQFTDALNAVYAFDRFVGGKEGEREELMAQTLAEQSSAQLADNAVGETSVSSTNFSSIMHNLIGQMILSIKAKSAAEEAVAIFKKGWKPIVTVSNTMESFVDDYIAHKGLEKGDEIGISFSDVIGRYLERTRRITVRRPDDTIDHIYIPIDKFSTEAQQLYAQAEDIIAAANFTALPVSPIDYVRNELTKAGIRAAEITGRSTMINYSGNVPTVDARPKTEIGPAGKRVSLAAFNRGDLDALILNRAGSTGVSAHAAPGTDRKRRQMLIAQADANIDTHMQMLGRVNRTGQVVLPGYTQLVAEIPAEARPAAVLLKKMASLNANTTAARKSALSGDSEQAVDFMNRYGDQIATTAMLDNPDWNDRLGWPVTINEVSGKPNGEDAMRKVTGRIVMLHPDEQRELIDLLTKNYNDLIEQLDAIGENALEAKTLDLEARTLESEVIKDGEGGSLFEGPATLERVSVKTAGKAMPPREIVEEILALNNAQDPPEWTRTDAPDRVISRIGAMMQPRREEQLARVTQGYHDWLKGELAAYKKQETRDKYQDRHDKSFDRFRSLYAQLMPGAIVQLEGGSTDSPAVVLRVSRNARASTNPAALSLWEATFALPDSNRMVVVPFNRLYDLSHPKGEEESGFWVTADVMDTGPELMERFDQASRIGREDRYVVTGNILAGFDAVDAKGQIVNYTTDAGEVRPGILMPKSFSVEGFKAARAIRFREPAAVRDYLTSSGLGIIKSTDKIVEIRTQDGGKFTIDLPAGRRTGGKYFTEQSVRKAVGDTFEKKGSRMRAEDLSAGQVERAVRAMMDLGAIFETREDQEIAQEINNRYRPVAAIDAYHGSPHRFMKFSASAIGSGEGAQAFGHGLYFAESKATAQSYQEGLSSSRLRLPSGQVLGGTKIIDHEEIMEALEKELKAIGSDLKWGSKGLGAFDLEDAIAPWYEAGAVALDDLPTFLRDPDAIDEAAEGGYGVRTAEEKARYRRERLKAADDIERLINAGLKQSSGEIYTVSIDANPDEFVDWDKPLGDQPPMVREAIMASGVLPTREGRSTVKDTDPIGDYVRGAIAAEKLAAQGIKGIRYFDLGSRGRQEGTRNYVVFDENLITIRDINGRPVSQQEAEGAVASVTLKGEPAPQAARPIGASVPIVSMDKEVRDRLRADIRSIIARVAGRRVDVDFYEEIRASDIEDLDMEGDYGDRGNPRISGVYFPSEIDPAIFIAMSGNEPVENLRATGYHEAWHHIELSSLLTDQERDVIAKDLARGEASTLRRYAELEIDTSTLSPREITAHAFQRYARNRGERGLHIGIRRIFEKLAEIMRQIRRTITGRGLTVNDIFGAAYRGQMAEREAQPLEQAPAASEAQLDLFDKMIEASTYNREGREAELYRRLIDNPETASPSLSYPEGVMVFIEGTVDGQPVSGAAVSVVVDGKAAFRMGEKIVRFKDVGKAMRLDARRDWPAYAQVSRPPREPTHRTYWRQRTERMLARTSRHIDVARRAFQDQDIFIRRLQEQIERDSGMTLPMPLNTWISSGLYTGRAGERMIDLRQKWLEPLIEEMQDRGVNREDLDEYLVARHARERNAVIRERDPKNDSGSGMTDEEAVQILSRVNASDKAQDFRDLADRVDTLNRETRKTLLRSGLISREVYDAWENQFQHYVPLRGHEMDEDPERPKTGRGFSIRGREAQRALGRGSMSDSPLAYSMMQAQQAIIRAEKNRVGKTVLKMVQSYPDPNVWEVTKGRLVKSFDKSTGRVVHRWQHPSADWSNENLFGVKVGGEQIFIDIKDPDFRRAVQRIGHAGFGMDNRVIQFVWRMSRFWASMRTQFDPEFVVSNFLRDIDTAMINVGDIEGRPKGIRRKALKMTFKNIKEIFQALRDPNRDTETARLWNEYRLAGGKVSFLQWNDVQAIKREMDKDLEAGRLRGFFRGLAQLVSDANTAVENGVRLAVYINLRRGGMIQDKAAIEAKELTVNFNRHGELGPLVNMLYVFANAGIQGTFRMGRAFAKSKVVRRTVYGLIAYGAVMDLLNALMSDDDDEGKSKYDQIPFWIKERNFIFMVPGSEDGIYIMKPAAYGYNLPMVLGQQLMATIRGAVTPAEATSNTAATAFSTFNPLGSAGSLLQFLSPTLLDPLVQMSEGPRGKTWYGGGLYPPKYDERKPDSQNVGTRDPKWAVELAQGLNELFGGNEGKKGSFGPIDMDFTPAVIDLWANFVIGGVGRFINNTAETGDALMGNREIDISQVPFARRIIGKAQGRPQLWNRFYEAWDRVDAANYEVQQLEKVGKDREADRALKENAKDIELYDTLKPIKSDLDKLRREKRSIENDRGMKAKDRQKEIEAIEEEERELLLEAMKAIK